MEVEEASMKIENDSNDSTVSQESGKLDCKLMDVVSEKAKTGIGQFSDHLARDEGIQNCANITLFPRAENTVTSLPESHNKYEEQEEHQRNVKNFKRKLSERADSQNNDDPITLYERRLCHQDVMRKSCRLRAFSLQRRLLKIYGDKDPLTELMETLRRKTKKHCVNYAVEAVDRCTYLRILELFDKRFCHPFYAEILIELLKIWFADEEFSMVHLEGILFWIYIHMSDIIDNYIESIMQITCTMKELTFLFERYKFNASAPVYIHNWPHILIRIDMPGFSLIRRMCSEDEYHLANNPKAIKPIQQSTKPYLKTSDKSFVMRSSIILELLTRLLNSIKRSNNLFNLHTKTLLIEVIGEFQSDIKLCGDFVQAHSEFYVFLQQFSYFRSIARNPTLPWTCLFQTSLPRLSFQIADARIFQYVDNIDLDKEIFPYTAVTYRCELCDEQLDWTSVSSFQKHLTAYHGRESTWNCSVCNLTLSTDELSMIRWRHNCCAIDDT